MRFRFLRQPSRPKPPRLGKEAEIVHSAAGWLLKSPSIRFTPNTGHCWRDG
jgi:hypothetical protein